MTSKIAPFTSDWRIPAKYEPVDLSPEFSLFLGLDASTLTPRFSSGLQDWSKGLRWGLPVVPDIRRFQELVSEWRTATAFSSRPMDLFMHPSYQKIIGMGPPVLPLILERLTHHLELWFWALEMIADQNPAAEGEPGDIEAMRTAWLRWGEAQGLISR